jgi:hypothetical protein
MHKNCPTGESCQASLENILVSEEDLFYEFQKYRLTGRLPGFTSIPFRPSRGALANVTDVGRNAVDADGAVDVTRLFADGEVVWFRHPDAGAKLFSELVRGNDGGKSARLTEEITK